MAIQSNRDEYTPSHFTEEVKDAAKNEAEREDKSLSRFIFEIVRDALIARGYKFRESD